MNAADVIEYAEGLQTHYVQPKPDRQPLQPDGPCPCRNCRG